MGLLWPVATAGTALLVVFGAIALSPHTPATSPAPSGSPTATGSGVPASVLARIALPGIEHAVVAGSYLWVTMDVDPAAQLVRIDLKTHAMDVVAEPVDFGLQLGDDGSLYASAATVSSGQITSTTLSRVDLDSGAFTPVALPPLPPFTRIVGTAFAEGSMWLSIESSGLPIDASAAALWRVDLATGHVTSRIAVDMAHITVACGHIWGEPQSDGGQVLREVDPSAVPTKVTEHPGHGPVYEVNGGCWRPVDDTLEAVRGMPSPTSVPAPSDMLFDGRAIWEWEGTRLQRWDVAAGAPFSPPLTLDAADARPASVTQQTQPAIAGAPDSIWLVTRNKLVQISIAPVPASPAVQSGETRVLKLGDSAVVSYPASWLKIDPQPDFSRAIALGTISSMPVGPCASSTCQGYTVPPNGVVIEFHFAAPQTGGEPDWASFANDTLGGQPAIRDDWGAVNAHFADEAHSWRVRLPSGLLLIDADVEGPDLASGRAALQQVLDSLVIGP
jgi:hypothetical protein